MEKYIRTDYIFSYWIFVWFLLYKAGIVKTSPKFLLIIAIFVVSIVLLYLIVKKTPFTNILIFLVIAIITKIIPLYLVWNTKINKESIISSFVVFIIYLFWLFVNKVNGYKSYKKFLDSYISNKEGIPTYPTYIIKCLLHHIR
jgi:hypothetical protein